MRSQFLPFLQWDFFVNVQKSHYFWVRSSWKKKDLDLTTYPTKVNIATYLRKKKWTSNFEKVHILARFCCFLANIAIFRLIINDFQKVRLTKLDLKSDQNMQKTAKHGGSHSKHEDLTLYPTKVNIATYSRQKKWTPIYEKCCFFNQFSLLLCEFYQNPNDFQTVWLDIIIKLLFCDRWNVSKKF